MKYTFIALLAIAGMFIFSSCTKNNIDKDESFFEFDDDKDKEECIVLLYPVSYTMPDGSTITGNEDELKVAMKEWYESNPDSKEKPLLQYPVNIKWYGEEINVVDEEEMISLKSECKEDDDKAECFNFVYPLTFSMPDGSTITGNKEELSTAMKEWYEAHPDSKEKPVLQYPIYIIYPDGSSTNIASEEELKDAYHACKNEDGNHDDDDDDGNDDDGNDQYDCPDIKADFGDECTRDDGTVGVVNEQCQCE